MKKITKTLAAIILLSGLLISQFYCKKDNKTSQNTTITPGSQNEGLARAQKFIEQKLQKGITQSLAFPKGFGKSTTSGNYINVGDNAGNRTNTICHATPSFVMKSYNITYIAVNGCGGGSPEYSYKVSYDFILHFDMSVSVSGIQQAFTNFHLTTGGGSFTNNINLTLTLVGPSSGTDIEYTTNVIDFSALSIDYCAVDGLYAEIWPIFTCSGSVNTIVDADYSVSGGFANYDRCATISPVFITGRTSTTVDYSGWVLTCTPCNFMGCEKFELFYRPQGSTGAWSSVTKDYYGTYTLTGLTSGVTYDYYYQNYNPTTLTGTPTPCYGPPSATGTF